jgi:23S rRNA (cytosine1962-C5)-methyltransferase
MQKQVYRLIDSGGRRKLEQCGRHRIIRPAPQAVWQPALADDQWRAEAEYIRSSSGGGSWQGELPEEWPVLHAGLRFLARPTGFGHIGFFAEQADTWAWIGDLCRQAEAPVEVLNLFAYTGGSTMAAAAAGARVCHVDAAAGVVKWARRNAAENGLEAAPIRWICDEALKFCRREARRGHRYQLIILDPPSFGRGPKGEVFKIESDLPPLLDVCAGLLADDALGVALSAHSPGFSPLVLTALTEDLRGGRGGQVAAAEMVVAASDGGRALPGGARALWSAG